MERRNFKTSLYIHYEVQWCSLQDKRAYLKLSTDFVLQIFNKGKRIPEVLKAVTMNILVHWLKILCKLFDWHNWRYWRKHGFSIPGKTVTLQRRSYNINQQNEHYHHHLHTSWRIIGLAIHSDPNNSLEIILRIALGFISHTVDIS